MLRKAVLSERRNSKTVLWHVPDIFSCIQYQEIKMKLSIYQNPLKDISAMFINNSFQKIWETIQSCVTSEPSSWIAVGENQVFKFQIAFFVVK